MITVSNLGMQFGGQWLFQHVDLQFLPGNCYGIIGANGAGKYTFLRILTGELDSTNGSVTIDPTKRVSVLKQNQNAYDDYTVMDTVIMGNAHLYEVMKEKDAIYEKPDFTDEDGLRAADLEAEFAELGGWEAESDASRLLQGLGIGTVRQPRHRHAGRADQQLGHRSHQLAGGFPSGLPRHGHRGEP